MHLGHLYTSFQGRISRALGWLGGIILGVVTLAALFAATFVVGISFDGNDSRLKFVIFALQLAFLYPSAALMVKRLHDRNRPGSLAAFLLVPVVVKQENGLAEKNIQAPLYCFTCIIRTLEQRAAIEITYARRLWRARIDIVNVLIRFTYIAT